MHLTFLRNQKMCVLNIMIKKNIIDKAPKPVGNYPHSVECDGVLYISGIGPRSGVDNSIPGNKYDSDNNLIEYNIEKQVHSVFSNVKLILEESNSSWNNLLDVTVFLIDMKSDFDKFNEIYNQYFIDAHSCRTTVEVNALPTDIAIELKCIARLNK